MVKQTAELSVAQPSRPDGKHIDPKSFSVNYSEGTFQRKSADSVSRLAAESLKTAVTSRTLSLTLLLM